KAFLQEVRVRGFRGIGREATLSINPGPGLTLVVGRNGSGKSSFAEAAELLVTRGNARWDARSSQWKEGFRNLHEPQASIGARFTVEGGRSCDLRVDWAEGAGLAERTDYVQFTGEPRTTYDALAWSAAAASYRPVLSYNELGGMLDEAPSKFFDALSQILGLEVLAAAGGLLRQARLDREKQQKELVKTQKDLAIKAASHSDRRGAQVGALLQKKAADLAAIERILEGDAAGEGAAGEMTTLRQVITLPDVTAEAVARAVEMLKVGAEALKAHSGTLAARSADLVSLLDSALRFHDKHGDGPCPVCGAAGVMDGGWHTRQQAQAGELRDAARAVNDAQALLKAGRDALKGLSQPSSGVLQAATAMGLPAAALAEAAERARAAVALETVEGVARIDDAMAALAAATAELKGQAMAELARREDLWRPMAREVQAWLAVARKAVPAIARLGDVSAAEKWLNGATDDLRKERFAPHADAVKRIWNQLRHNSNVSLEDIRLLGTAVSRRVQVDVAVDGAAAPAVGVMSQGELHSLALALFLPRATMAASPFGFVLIDDPVQSMDPSRIDGLATVLRDAAQTRQVIVFTHDDRLTESVRRQGIEATVLEVTRREKSVVDVRKCADPVRLYIEDASAVALTKDLPADARKRVVPGLCRGALEAAAIRVLRRRWLGEGVEREVVEKRLAEAEKVTQKMALVLFGDGARGGEVLTRLNKEKKEFADVLRAANEGAHGASIDMEPMELVNATERLAAWLVGQK
ncbi:MAG: AAA family ATPase, partial [Vicinamibacteria bacterium]|nr:AAA family ATPase [Vicinamibacteria bacterium]